MSWSWKKLLLRSGAYRLFSPLRRRLSGLTCCHFWSDRAVSLPESVWDRGHLFPEIHGSDAIDLHQPFPKVTWSYKPLSGTLGRFDPQGLPSLRDRIAGTTGREVLITSGGRGALATVLETFVDGGCRIALFDPSPGIFPIALKQRGARLQWIASTCEAGVLRFDLKQFRKQLRGCRLLLLCHPNNPTGSRIAAEDLEQIAFWAERYDCLIYSDESFAPFCFGDRIDSIAEIPAARSRTLVGGSFTSGMGQRDLQIGWLMAVPSLLKVCIPIQAFLGQIPSIWCQEQAGYCWDDFPAKRSALRVEYHRLAEFVRDRLTLIGLQPIRSSCGFFIWCSVEATQWTGAEFQRELMLQARTLVQRGDVFGPSGRSFIRISLAAEEGRLREGINRLISVVQSRL